MSPPTTTTNANCEQEEELRQRQQMEDDMRALERAQSELHLKQEAIAAKKASMLAKCQEKEQEKREMIASFEVEMNDLMGKLSEDMNEEGEGEERKKVDAE
jgi:hypothetical protein